MIDFYDFWQNYPRRVGKKQAQRLWNKLTPQEHVQIMCGLELWKQTYQWQSAGGTYIPYASTFLHQRRWEDEPWTGAFESKS